MTLKTSTFNPLMPCIGSDGLEYEDFAARIEGRPKDCWRNNHVQDSRARGVRESDIRTWCKAYDEGGEPEEVVGQGNAARHVRANFAVSQYGEGLAPQHGGFAQPIQWHPRAADRASVDL